jgi:hypothetical protein
MNCWIFLVILFDDMASFGLVVNGVLMELASQNNFLLDVLSFKRKTFQNKKYMKSYLYAIINGMRVRLAAA